jgi:8-oxo-dGTP diphosphatase
MSGSYQMSGSLGLAVNADGKFLLTKRNDPRHAETHQKWQVPGGGVEFGEDPIETMTREIREELGVTVTRILFPYPIARKQIWGSNGQKVQVNLLCFLITIGNQEIVLSDEATEYGWFLPEEVATLDNLPLTPVFTREAQQILNRYSLDFTGGMLK